MIEMYIFLSAMQSIRSKVTSTVPSLSVHLKFSGYEQGVTNLQLDSIICPSEL